MSNLHKLDKRILQMLVSYGDYQKLKSNFMNHEDATTSYCVYLSLLRSSKMAEDHYPSDFKEEWWNEFVKFQFSSVINNNGIVEIEWVPALIYSNILESPISYPDTILDFNGELSMSKLESFIDSIESQEVTVEKIFNMFMLWEFEWLDTIMMIGKSFIKRYHFLWHYHSAFIETIECGLILYILKENQLIDSPKILKPLIKE